jgi:hypothetical protein
LLFTWRASNVFEKKRHAIALDFTPESTPIVHLIVPIYTTFAKGAILQILKAGTKLLLLDKLR